MKQFFYIIIVIFVLPLAGYSAAAPCAAVSPPAYTGNFNGDDAGSPGCTCGVWDWASVKSDASGNCMLLTGATCDIATYSSPLSLGDSFCISFDFTTNAADVSDGVAMSLSGGDYTCGGTFPCNEGGNIGYNGINGSSQSDGVLTVEYDVFDNSPADDDPSGAHVSIVQDSDNGTSVDQATVSGIDDGNTHSTQICWNATCQEFSVEVDGNMVASYCGDIGADFFGGTGDNVFITLSSGYNAGFTGQNTICNFDIQPMADVTCQFDASCNFLGIEEGSFRGEVINDNIEISWVEDKDYVVEYVLEKSIDGKNYTALHSLSAGEDKSKYVVLDENPVKGNNYYRVRQIEFTGVEKYSDVIVVNYRSNQSFSIEYHNNLISVNTELRDNYEVFIYDINGKLVQSSKHKGSSSISIPNKNDGIYFVNLLSEKEVISKKIFVLNE